MNSETQRKSLVEQILEITFDKLNSIELFHSENVSQLRRLARDGDLRRYSRIIDALKTDLGERDETA